jgi:hypothetical protein
MIPNIIVDPIYHEMAVVAEPSSYGFEHHYHIAEHGQVSSEHVVHDLTHPWHTAEKAKISVTNTQPEYVKHW